ncbi:hypothetical protein OE88DRAFT_162821 [Heliocybe sulcata]|uniref:Uncharacterized protein n=1 Tax=Heliocybe sulcata TaxID=5364 RepID=A0A5C3NJV9_9AGAM|nr:hypothetical protein OE88DRAFT_162821 [Heliocybe sulcata]
MAYTTSLKAKIALSSAYSFEHNPRRLEGEWHTPWIAVMTQVCEGVKGLHFTSPMPVWAATDEATELEMHKRRTDQQYDEKMKDLMAQRGRLTRREGGGGWDRDDSASQARIEELKQKYRMEMDAITRQIAILRQGDEADEAEDRFDPGLLADLEGNLAGTPSDDGSNYDQESIDVDADASEDDEDLNSQEDTDVEDDPGSQGHSDDQDPYPDPDANSMSRGSAHGAHMTGFPDFGIRYNLATTLGRSPNGDTALDIYLKRHYGTRVQYQQTVLIGELKPPPARNLEHSDHRRWKNALEFALQSARDDIAGYASIYFKQNQNTNLSVVAVAAAGPFYQWATLTRDDVEAYYPRGSVTRRAVYKALF